MVSVQSIINLYPNSDIDSIIKMKDYKKVHLYVDVKNVSRSLFIPDVMQEILENKTSKYVDSTIFQSYLYFSGVWKFYCKKHNLDLKIFYCTDDGESFYHKNIFKEYKNNREIGNINLPAYYDDFTKVKRMNINIAEKIVNKIPDNYYFVLKYLESDFLPYFLITRVFDDEENILHLILSGDKDLYQCETISDDVYQIFKSGTEQVCYNIDNCLMKFFNINNSSLKCKDDKIRKFNKFDNKYFDLALSIIGDKVDNVPGINSLGPKRVLDIMSDKDFIMNYFGKKEDIIDRLLKKEDILLIDDLTNDKYKNLLIENSDILNTSYKLVSFEYLTKVFEGNYHMALNEKYDYVFDIIENEDKYDSFKKFYNDLNFLDLYVTEQDIEILFS